MMTNEFFLNTYTPAAWMLSGLFACATTLVPILRGRMTEDAILIRWMGGWVWLMVFAILYNALTLNIEGAAFVAVSAFLQAMAFLFVTTVILSIIKIDPNQYEEWIEAMPDGHIEANVRSAIRKELLGRRRYR